MSSLFGDRAPITPKEGKDGGFGSVLGYLSAFANMMGFEGNPTYGLFHGEPEPPPDMTIGPGLDFDPSPPAPTDDVVPIAGDSSPEDFSQDASNMLGDHYVPDTSPAPTPPPAPPADPEMDAIINEIIDRLDNPAAPPPPATPTTSWLRPKIVIPVAVGAAAIAGVTLFVTLSSSSSTPSATPPATTAAQTTTAAAAPTATPSVTMNNFGLMSPQGFQFTLQALNSPHGESVTLDFTGPGLPTSQTVSVPAGGSLSLKYPTSGCGKWTVRIAAINGNPVDSKGNPALENGMTHNC